MGGRKALSASLAGLGETGAIDCAQTPPVAQSPDMDAPGSVPWEREVHGVPSFSHDQGTFKSL